MKKITGNEVSARRLVRTVESSWAALKREVKQGEMSWAHLARYI
jgi:hypothetical protein